MAETHLESMIELADEELDEVTGGDNSCNGLIVADVNHAAGAFSPSGNPNASVGPGYFSRQNTGDEIALARGTLCD